jgi:hypothetical protein
MANYKYIVEQAKVFNEEANDKATIDKWWVVGHDFESDWSTATSAAPGDEEYNAKVVGDEVDDSSPLSIGADDWTISDGTTEATVVMDGTEETIEDVMVKAEAAIADAGLNMKIKAWRKEYKDGSYGSYLEIESTGTPGTSDEITLNTSTGDLSIIGLTEGTTNGTKPDTTIVLKKYLGGMIPTTETIDNPDIPRISYSEMVDDLEDEKNKRTIVVQEGLLDEEEVPETIEKTTYNYTETVFDDTVDTPITGSALIDSDGIHLYKKGLECKENLGTQEAYPHLHCGEATGDLDGKIAITAVQGSNGNITINIEDGGLFNEEHVVVDGTTMTVYIDSGNSTQRMVATAIRNHELIKSVVEDTPEEVWTVGEGSDTITLTGGNDDYSDTFEMSLNEPTGTVSSSEDATVSIYDGNTLIAYADESGNIVDTGNYIDSGSVNYSEGIITFTTSYEVNNLLKAHVFFLDGSCSDERYEPVETTTEERAKEENYHVKYPKKVLQDAKSYGLKVAEDFTAENIRMGITQAGETNNVRNAMKEVWNCLVTGSLHSAIDEAELVERSDPFLSEARIRSFINSLKDYLGISY